MKCFKRRFEGKERVYPEFPYPENIEDEYDDGVKKWQNDPLIIKWNEECNKLDDRYNEEQNREFKYLEKCPLCRK